MSKDKTQKLDIRVERELADYLRGLAKQKHETTSMVVREALREYRERRKREEGER